jgi:hypothetical protein
LILWYKLGTQNQRIRKGEKMATPKIKVKKIMLGDDRLWVIKERFFNPQKTTPYYKMDPMEMVEHITVVIRLWFDKNPSTYKLVMEIEEFENFVGNYEKPINLARDISGLKSILHWKTYGDTSLLTWLYKLSEGSYLCPTDKDRTGGETYYQVRMEEWRQERAGLKNRSYHSSLENFNKALSQKLESTVLI